VASEGKTITAANLAVAFAQAGRRVILVDADLRRPAIHALFRLPNSSGLTSLLRDTGVPLDNVLYTVAQEENLRILTSGPGHLDPSALLGSPAMQVLMKRLTADADLLIFDSPPLQAAVDATVLGTRVEGTLLVIDASRSHRAAVLEACETLTDAHARIIGAVLYQASRTNYPDDHYGAVRRAGGSVSPALDRTDVT
jgi:capsular exopolysaccharide synthesis family protein